MSYPGTYPQTATTCHCGSPMRGSDHCPECGCEEYESYCQHTYDPAHPDAVYGPGPSPFEVVGVVYFESEAA